MGDNKSGADDPVAATHHEDNMVEAGAAIELAVQVEQKQYSPWTPHMFRLYLVLSCAYLCGCLNGYDGSLMGGLNGMTAYQNYFNMWVPCSPDSAALTAN